MWMPVQLSGRFGDRWIIRGPSADPDGGFRIAVQMDQDRSSDGQLKENGAWQITLQNYGTEDAHGPIEMVRRANCSKPFLSDCPCLLAPVVLLPALQQHGIPGEEQFIWIEAGHSIRHTTYENSEFTFRYGGKGQDDPETRNILALKPMIGAPHTEL